MFGSGRGIHKRIDFILCRAVLAPLLQPALIWTLVSFSDRIFWL